MLPPTPITPEDRGTGQQVVEKQGAQGFCGRLSQAGEKAREGIDCEKTWMVTVGSVWLLIGLPYGESVQEFSLSSEKPRFLHGNWL